MRTIEEITVDLAKSSIRMAPFYLEALSAVKNHPELDYQGMLKDNLNMISLWKLRIKGDKKNNVQDPYLYKTELQTKRRQVKWLRYILKTKMRRRKPVSSETITHFKVDQSLPT